MAINKVVLNDVVKLDLTGDTVTADKLSEGITAHDAAGNPVTGTMVVTTPTLTVSTNAGASVTATKGTLSVSGTADSSGSCVLGLPEFGEWMVTVTYDGVTKSETVNVTADNQATVYAFLTVTVSGSPSSTYGYVTVDGTKYSTATTINVAYGKEISVYVGQTGNPPSGYTKVIHNGNTVQTGAGTYTFTVEENTVIGFSYGSWGASKAYVAEITTASYDTSAAVASILLGGDV